MSKEQTTLREEANLAEKQATAQLYSVNATYLEDLYELYLTDPSQVDAKWRDYFSQIVAGGASGEVKHSALREKFTDFKTVSGVTAAAAGASEETQTLLRVIDLLYAYRRGGHHAAHIDPLHLAVRKDTLELDLSFHHLTPLDLNKTFDLRELGIPAPLTLKSLFEQLKTTYCGPVGFEYMHISTREERVWLQQKIESLRLDQPLSTEKQRWLLERLSAADGLEKYFGMRYVGQKRFSLEGGDAFIPLIDEIIAQSAQLGAEEIAIGMAHRGRLNVLVNIMGKAPQELFREFEGVHEHALLSGDVKYHNGFSSDIQAANGKVVHLALGFNPSHLEIVSPVIEGSVRARQDRRSGAARNEVLAIQVHGDSAFAGQGVVMETLNMSLTRAYGIGGSIHIIINNQVGFTTSNPCDLRSTYYCTDIGKMIEVPIFHVNADCPEAVIQVAQLAVEYRYKFGKNVLIDLVCYRRHGHNEGDEPSGTQPLMYKVIKDRPSIKELYAKQLESAAVIQPGFLESCDQAYKATLSAGQCAVKNILSTNTFKSQYIADWAPFKKAGWADSFSTALPHKKLLALAQALDQRPDWLVLQKQVEKTLDDRVKMTAGELPVNWGYAEVLAYASIADAGVVVRMSGEDCRRGTFSHRHAALHSMPDDQVYVPLEHVSPQQAPVMIYDSTLSEEAVLAFEYGYSSSAPNAIVIWEAQFGDFVNGAQVVIDQFLSSGEEKWGRLCGLVLLLPHGQEGAGAEHSSARLERFLQLCAHDNMQVCVPTTPAQIFHLLRRQGLKAYRKPLIVMTPKSLLRSPAATSTLNELSSGEFQLVIPEQFMDAKKVKRVVLCQGKVYYDLVAKREELKIQDVAVVRIEQLYPFPEQALRAVLAQYQQAQDIVWCQEEPKNQGPWHFIRDHLTEILTAQQQLKYAGRQAFAAPAVGYPALYKEQQAALVQDALGIKG